MIHAYNDYFVSIAQDKLGCMFELAVVEEKIDIEQFTKLFINSYISKAFEKADPVFLEGKSANELLALVLSTEPKEYKESGYASPEYWVGYVLAYTQWYLNNSFKEIINNYSISKLWNNYFPYHEMDIMQTVDLIKKHLPVKNTLKEMRTKKGYSQSDLSTLSNVSIRNIRAYEQETNDISKANAETLFALANVLDCTIEDLIK